MPILLPKSILEAQARESRERSLKMDLLAILLTKPVRFLTEIPQDWTHCVHVDVEPAIDPESGESAPWLDPDTQIRPMLDSLVGHLAVSERTPVDICAVKSHGMYSIVIKTIEPESVAA